MTTREKIILGVAAAALIYGGITVALPKASNASHRDATNRQVEALRRRVEKTQRELQTNALTRAEVRVLENAVSDWPASPFREGPVVAAGAKTNALAIVYAGYLNMNGKRLAVVNGAEYRVNDLLKSGDFVVESIEPEKVVLSRLAGGAKLVVPIETQEPKREGKQ